MKFRSYSAKRVQNEEDGNNNERCRRV